MKSGSLVLTTCILIAGCGGDAPQFPSPEGKPYPYILKEGCQFTITEERSKASIQSKYSGDPTGSASASITHGDKSITVSNCKVIENPNGLPIYESSAK